jgi:hypothetical protein
MVQDAENHRQIKRITYRTTGINFLTELKNRLPAFLGQRLDKSVDSPA